MVAQLLWEQWVAGSNPATRICWISSVVEQRFCKPLAVGSNPTSSFSCFSDKRNLFVILIKALRIALHATKRKFLEYKRSLRCEHCGNNDARVLEFHHLGDKETNVSTLVSRKAAWSKIMAEINKCSVLCANCHRIEHSKFEAEPLKDKVIIKWGFSVQRLD